MEYRFTARQKDNGWQLILRYKMRNGKWGQRTKQGYAKRSHALAESEKEKLLASIPPETSPELKDITLGGFLEIFMRDHEKTLTYNTLKNYPIAFARISKLLPLKMKDITYADILNAINQIDLKPSSVNVTIQKVKALYNYATDVYHLFEVNPVAKLPPRKERADRKVRTLSDKELERLLESLSTKPELHAIASIAAFAGLRFGEIVGLTRADIDLKTQVIHVKRQYGRIAQNTFSFMPTKSKNGYRTVPIPPKLVTTLRNYIQQSKIIQLDGRIFTLKESVRLNEHIRKEIKGASVHKLRHTYATKLLANGIDIKTVAALVGDDVNTVIKTYIHFTDDMREKAHQDVKVIFS